MKKFRVFLIVIFLFSSGSVFQQLKAQDKTKEDQEKDAKIQQSIEQQKKAMAEQKKAWSMSERDMKKRHEEIDSTMGEADEELENADKERTNIFMRMPRGDRSFNFEEPYLMSSQDWQGFLGHEMGGDSQRTTWDFSKTVKDNTFSGDYTFDVEKTSKSVVMSVMGDCKSGEIRIKIVMPNGKNYSDILIDESGNLNWRKSFTISENENQDKTGSWKFQISSAKATGFFKVSLQAY
jgi:ATPase subunit of ABC transporter with duplicated ATPase domains